MCSITAVQLARICRAIEELAGQPDVPDTADALGRDGAAGDAPAAAPDDTPAARLAQIWAMLAEADPELAKRVPGYLSAAD
ncbi:MAG TPA: hypothetical protein VMF87_21340 [Streptosporangiaceae bacterium]|nr:hypothetical protein [Streptosporangiaceae bacterium]